MKKLTAGILATLIGLVSANSADASVASTNYVDEGLATKQNVLANDVNVVTAGEGGFVTGVSAVDGVVTVSYGDQAEVEAATAEKAGVAKLYTTTGGNQDGAMTQKATTDELNLKQVKLTSTGDNANVVKSGTGAFITGVTATDGTVTFTTGDVTFDETLSETSTNGVQNKVIKAAIDLKQDKLNSGEGGNITVQGQEGDNVVTGISAANGVVTVTTGYFDHTDTKIADEVTADITQDEITADQDSAAVSSYSLIKYVDAMGNESYKWELIDRVYPTGTQQ